MDNPEKLATLGKQDFEFGFKFLVFNATFSNISAISWRPVLVVEEAGVPGESRTTDPGKATGKLYHLRL